MHSVLQMCACYHVVCVYVSHVTLVSPIKGWNMTCYMYVMFPYHNDVSNAVPYTEDEILVIFMGNV